MFLRKSMHLNGFLTITILALFSICSNPPTKDKNTQDANKVSISGKMQNSLHRGGGGIDDADSIYAVGIIAGEMDGNWNKMPAAVIGADGTFKINIEKTTTISGNEVPVDWVLLLINSKAATRFDKVVGFLAIKELDQSMIKFPASKSKKDSISLGTVTVNGDEAVSDSSIKHDTTTFYLTMDQLKNMANTGRTLKIIKNAYGNFNPITQKSLVDIRPSYNLAFVHMAAVKNHELTPHEYFDTGKVSLSIQMFGNDLSVFDTQKIHSRQKTIDLYPPCPMDVQNIIGDHVYTAHINEFMSTDTSLNPFINIDTLNNTARVNVFALGAGECVTLFFNGFKGMSPNGIWKLKEDRTNLLVQFDLGIGTPFDTTTGKPFIYIPSVRVSVNAADTTISQISANWYHWEGSAYAMVTDAELIQNSITFIQFSIHANGDQEDYAYGKGIGVSGDLATVPAVPVFTPKKRWVYKEPTEMDGKFTIQVSFGVCGQTFEIRIEDHKR
ncbi:MAG: hypothetical protein JW795_23435 [Chitinivibrionales bacterium]|nr:hypothetical protein [Chitinivibrionales bacterium]